MSDDFHHALAKAHQARLFEDASRAAQASAARRARRAARRAVRLAHLRSPTFDDAA